MTRSEVERIDAMARQGWHYEVDDFMLYHWRSHADAVLNGEPWEGPCADLTSTTFDLMMRGVAQGHIELSDCYRLLVSSTGSDKPDHMVGAVHTEEGDWVIIGDTFKTAYGYNLMPHHGICYNRLSEAGPLQTIWRKGNPWQLKENA